MELKLFTNPPKSYREVPFWSWNDALDPQELVRQIELIDQAGWGGFFIHSRVGIKTPYLGRRWMECVGASVAAARERGMGAWLYDEDKWPSGYAGGLSVAANPTFRAHYLVCKVDNRPALLPERIATFAAREVNGVLVDFRRDDHPTLVEEEDRLVQFYPLIMPLGQEVFNDYAYVDLLNPEAVRAFLACTHQAYADHFPDELGKSILGVFTDEPAYIARMLPERSTFVYLPWTEGFGEYFQAQAGYDLLPHLPAMFFPGVENCQAVRYDFFKAVTRRFVDSYTRQVSEWCEQHNLIYTGHCMAEDTLLEQVHWSGAAMQHYPYMHQPGIDKLWRMVNGYCGEVMTVKQLDSVVCQTGKQRALCENYGGAGPDLAHTGRKWIGDWCYVLGITFNNPHLSLYSLRGERKRDWPQNLFYQQPWWPDNHLVADYFARLSYVLSQGQRMVDILMIHPMGSAWAVFQPGATQAVDELDEKLIPLNLSLMQHQRDFHLADESLVAPDGLTPGKVVRGADGPRLEVGLMSYRLVIVPPGVTLAATSVDLLAEFAAAGGPVLALAPVPNLIDARPASRPVLPATARVLELNALPAALDELLPYDVQAPGQTSVWIQHRRVDNREIYFLANIDPDHGTHATVNLRGAGRLERWDPATGAVTACPAQVRDDITQVSLEFAPAGSYLLVLDRDEAPVPLTPAAPATVSETRLGSRWKISTDSLNSLTLDKAQLKIGNSVWSPPMYILDARRTMMYKGLGTAFALRFELALDQALPQPLYLAIESPQTYTIRVNGRVIPSLDCGWWVDISFRQIDLGGALQVGINEIILESTYRLDSEIEAIYLLGQFGVFNRRIGFENRVATQVFERYSSEAHLGAIPQTMEAEERSDGLAVDVTSAGFSFYAGRVRLNQTLTLPTGMGRAALEFSNLRAAVAKVWVNGTLAGSCAWEPHRVELGGSLVPGDNRIEIELAGSLRNLLGPHHRAGGDTESTGPNDFNDRSRWTDDTILVPMGFDHVTIYMDEV